MLCTHPSDTDKYLDELKENPCQPEVVRCLECGWIAATQPHPKVHRQDIAGQMHAMLPREIRDIIYSYCWGSEALSDLSRRSLLYGKYACPSTIIRRSKWTPNEASKTNPSQAPLLSEWTCRCMNLTNTPYYAIPRYVGIEAAREVAAAYYSLQPRPKKFERLLVQGLQRLLTRDVFHVGIFPGDYLKDLKLHIQVPRAITMEEHTWPKKVRTLKVPLNMPACKTHVRDNLNALRSIRLRHELEVRLEIDQGLKVDDVMMVLECFEPIFHELKRGGAKIDIWMGSLFSFDTKLEIPEPTDSSGLSNVYESEKRHWLRGKRRNLY